jgi:hypothetical protein
LFGAFCSAGIGVAGGDGGGTISWAGIGAVGGGAGGGALSWAVGRAPNFWKYKLQVVDSFVR